MINLMPIFTSHFSSTQHGTRLWIFWHSLPAFALAGAIYLASRRSVLGLDKVIALSSLTYSLAIAAFALSNVLWLSLLIVPIAGWGMLAANFASANTILQTLADDDKRGRVMSFFSMCFVGMTPFGVLAAGELATHLGKGQDPIVGASRTILLAAGCCLIASLAYAGSARTAKIGPSHLCETRHHQGNRPGACGCNRSHRADGEINFVAGCFGKSSAAICRRSAP